MHLTFKRPLPGKNAQLEMAPPYRIPGLLGEAIPQGAQQSAVLTLLTPENDGKTPGELLEWKVLLVRRNEYPGVHSGQISFPGGRCEEGDRGFWETACREAAEEVGVSKGDLKKVGRLTSLYVPPSNFVIHPFVALRRSENPIQPDCREVVELKNIPVKAFDPTMAVMMDFEPRQGEKRIAPAWHYDGFVIWGATAMILAELYRLMAAGALVRA